QASGPENRAWETAGGPGLRGLQLARLANERVSEGGEGLPALRDRDRRKPGGWPAPRERSRRPTGSGGIPQCAAREAGRALTEPARRRPPRQRGEAERESAHAGRRGLGASEERSARRARAPDGPPESIDPCEAGGYLRARQSAHPREHPLAAAPEFPNISRT